MIETPSPTPAQASQSACAAQSGDSRETPGGARPSSKGIHARVLVGDVLDRLRYLPDGSVHCIVTSPPYWNLRRYGGDSHEIGGEPTPELYVEHMLGVARELWRVLRNDGTWWLNIADSYAASGRGGNPQESPYQLQATNAGSLTGLHRREPPTGLKPLDLCLIPFRLALALQADGWYLRSDVTWAKPSCMPESISGWSWRRCRVNSA